MHGLGPISVENRARLDPAAFSALAATLSDQRTIKHAVDWLVAKRPPILPSDSVAQDEFSHDILVPYHDGLWLVYDCT